MEYVCLKLSTFHGNGLCFYNKKSRITYYFILLFLMKLHVIFTLNRITYFTL
jgi:hypothetical protein